MTIVDLVLFPVLTVSLIGNLYFYIRKPSLKRGQSLELQEFLADLMGGTAVIAVNRIDPSSILIRSPRGRE